MKPIVHPRRTVRILGALILFLGLPSALRAQGQVGSAGRAPPPRGYVDIVPFQGQVGSIDRAVAPSGSMRLIQIPTSP